MLNLSVEPYTIQKNTVYALTDVLDGFPILTIDKDSYIAGLQVDSSLEAHGAERYCLAIGKGCSLSESLTFMIDMNHEYGAVSQGELSFLQGIELNTIHRKGTIILQNDVWVGHGTTVMSGVTLHNGCVVATDAVVTKDVPPYAIVGGNPAKIIRYRFDEATIAALQKIAWWDWTEELLKKRKEDFLLPPPEFAKKYLPEAEEKQVVLFVPDIDEPYPLYSKILGQFFAKDRPNVELLIYLPQEDSTRENLLTLETVLRQYEDRDSYVTMQTGVDLDEHMLFQAADYFVTTRCRETVRRTCLADLYSVKILYGTDEPMFPAGLE